MDSKHNVESVTPRLSPSPSGQAEGGDGAQSAASRTPNGIRSSPPAMAVEVSKMLDTRSNPLEDVASKSDSEAETIVLPGKDGHSPSKIRKTKIIKHEDKSGDEEMRDASDVDAASVAACAPDIKSQEADKTSEVATSTLGKRKRSKHGNKDDPAYTGNSSGLSSVPTSPVATTRSSLSKPAGSDSDLSKSPSPRITVREAKSVDRVLSRRKHRCLEDEGEARKFSRQQSSNHEQRQTRDHRNSSRNSDSHAHHRIRSISPPPRIHKRSISTQLPSGAANGLSHKKKRVPAPLQSTEHQSDDSSASEGSHPRSSRLRHLAAPTTGDSAMSPAKMPHKKRVDPHGSTPLARACSNGNLEQAKLRLQERPDDLNVPDYSGNTPLQSASLRGHDHIVKFLLDAKCIIDSVNEAQDTPLLDAIDNGHLEVVKLLLDAGANPHKANIHGEEPLERVDKDADDAEEMRNAINTAKLSYRLPRRASEEDDGRLSHPTESPRQTPPIQTPQQQAFGTLGRRGGGGRAVKTSNDLLYRSSDVNELRRAAGMNEVENVARILELKQGKNGWNDPETLINAARGGHIGVLNILLAMGDFDPDPEPLASMPSRFATPMLAAIGRDGKDWLPVIEILVSQPGFNPTRKISGETYAEIARKRGGAFWQEEAEMLESAVDKYKKLHRSSPVQSRSPGLRRDAKRLSRDEPEPSARAHKRRASSPKVKDTDPKKRDSTGQAENKRGHQRSNSSTSLPKDGPHGQIKRGPGRPKKEEVTAPIATSDREMTPLGPPKQKLPVKKSESDITTAISDTEAVKPRRKLVSGKDLKGERERKRRASVVSNTSSASTKERSGPSDVKSGALNKLPRLLGNDADSKSEVSKHDRARSLKRDDSKDRLSAIRGESPVKRHRTSVTPPRMSGSESTEGVKRRKLDVESKDRRKTDTGFSSSPDHRTNPAKSGLSKERTVDTKDTKDTETRKSNDETGKHHAAKTKRSSTSDSKEQSKPTAEERNRDVAMTDASQAAAKEEKEREARALKEKEEKEKEAKQKQEAEKKLEEERIEQLKQAQLAKEKQAEEDERIEQLKQARLAREKLLAEEEAKRQQEEAEKREIQRQKDAEAHQRAQEERQRLYLEQQRIAKEEQERRRREREAEQRAEKLRIAQEKEKERMEKLPFLLRWFEKCANPRNAEILSLFTEIEGFRGDTIKPDLTSQAGAKDQWMLNTHVALLLGEKDLSLSRFTSWERIPLSENAKKAVYLYEGTKYCLTDHRLRGVRNELLGDEYGIGKDKKPLRILDEIARPLFHAMELFFVKLSDFMYIVPTFAHLRGVEMVVNYRELVKFPNYPPEAPKWKQDDDTDPEQIWQPRPTYWKDGLFVRQAEEKRAVLKSYDQFVSDQANRRQSLSPSTRYHSVSADAHSGSGLIAQQTNGITPPSSDKSLNGGSPHPAPAQVTDAGTSHTLTNGTIASPSESGPSVDSVTNSL